MTTALKEIPATDLQPVQPSDPYLAMIERAARDPSVDIDKMERLLAMKRQIDADHALKVFNAAMAAMQPELPVIQERGSASYGGKGGGYSYARWEDIVSQITPVLSRHGFSLTFSTETVDDRIVLIGHLRHAGGHVERSSYVMPYDNSGGKNIVQSIGSSTSYGKRYTSMALVNFTTTASEDDDGRSGGNHAISHDEFTQLMATLEAEGIDVEAFCRRYRIDAVSQLPAAKLALVHAEIRKRRATIDAKSKEA